VDSAAPLTSSNREDTDVAASGRVARADGVVIGERYWAFAGTDGTLREGRMPVAPRTLRAIPLARGLVRLSGSLSPLFKREGVARGRERIFLIGAILAPLALAFAPNWLGLTAGFVTTFALLGWLRDARSTCTVPSTVQSPHSSNGGFGRPGTVQRCPRASRCVVARTSPRC
jgi:hypothetical protein